MLLASDKEHTLDPTTTELRNYGSHWQELDHIPSAVDRDFYSIVEYVPIWHFAIMRLDINAVLHLQEIRLSQDCSDGLLHSQYMGI